AAQALTISANTARIPKSIPKRALVIGFSLESELEQREERFCRKARSLLTEKPQTVGKDKRRCFSLV
ncbi:MAG TPA: hypothetical protein PL105_04670, partial [Caldilineaceae bacterium]|nr:hypothetical protein [Caldilineaceae bacterium]